MIGLFESINNAYSMVLLLHIILYDIAKQLSNFSHFMMDQELNPSGGKKFVQAVSQKPLGVEVDTQ